MFTKTIAAGFIALTSLAAAAPANATGLSVQIGGPNASLVIQAGQRDWRPAHFRTLSPQDVRKVLRHRGYREIRYIDRKGAVYQVRAEDRRGRDYRLVVSARSGAIISAQRLRG